MDLTRDKLVYSDQFRIQDVDSLENNVTETIEDWIERIICNDEALANLTKISSRNKIWFTVYMYLKIVQFMTVQCSYNNPCLKTVRK